MDGIMPGGIVTPVGKAFREILPIGRRYLPIGRISGSNSSAGPGKFHTPFGVAFPQVSAFGVGHEVGSQVGYGAFVKFQFFAFD